MRKKVFSTVCLSLFLGLVSAFAQKELKGNILDIEGVPIPGVNVILKDTKKGAVTDFDGNFSISAPPKGILQISSLGFSSINVSYEGYNKINIILKESSFELNEILIVGSRNPSRAQIDTPVAVDILDLGVLSKSVPQVNLNQMLNYVAPSFTSNTQTISDGTDHIDPASLRGLGPDQVLVLVNGKRRHNTSLININGTFGRGSVGTDLNSIPASSIKRIEVLRDGAAAQYGSDAIAGVINIVLKNNTNTLTIAATSGANFSKNANSQTGGVDGETTNISASYGLKIAEKGGYINFSGDFDVRKEYNRMKEWRGSIFNRLNAIEYQASQNGSFNLNTLYEDYAALSTYAQNVPYFSQGLKNDIAAAAGASDLSALRALLSADSTEEELNVRGMSRTDFNMRIGQSSLRGGRLFVNMSLPIDDNGTELYAFSGLSSRNGNSAGFYRLPNQSRTFTPQYINGFLPEINSKITDKSMAVGIKGKIGDWNVDFSNAFGRNQFLYEISNTQNTSMEAASSNRFDAGGYSFAQNTTNLDFSKFYKETLNGLNIAFGLEHRTELYEIYAGELGSYAQYDQSGNVITSSTQTPIKDFFGATRPGGAQVFPGFRPENEISKYRSSVAAYVDFELDVSEKLLLTFATRFENYSDFGSTTNFKFSTRYKLTDVINLRGSANSGFRAPSLHQLYYNSTSTVFNNAGNPQEVGTFSNDSKVAKLLGIPELKQEISKSLSLGITANVTDANLKFTLDGYIVGIKDRVVYTGSFKANGDITLQNLFNQAGASSAAFFANAIDTESKGLDVVITHNSKFGKATLKTDLALTLSQTKKIGDINSTPGLSASGQESTFFDESARVYLEEAVPRTKANLSNTFAFNKFDLFLRNVYFGPVKEAVNNIYLQQEFSSKIVTDLSVSYNVNKNLNLTIGANNLLDIYPDKASEADLDPSANGTQNNLSDGRFEWSRRAQQFGIAGRFLFARMTFNLK
ncbi:TonB-dependent receptor [uncultured Flavobacterium sp.]|uniref:TonB-dependent receptor n=1 Tax=uncultured Flavobacterium sp. TaxID=165435 RepID=UPI0030CA30FD